MYENLITAVIGATIATIFHAASGIAAAKADEKDKFKFDWEKLATSYALTLSVALAVSSGFLPQEIQGQLDGFLGNDILAYTGSTVVLSKFISAAQNTMNKEEPKK